MSRCHKARRATYLQRYINTNSISGVLRMPSPYYQLCRVPCIAQKFSNVGCGCRVESLFFGGMKGEVWIQPGKLPSQVSTFWKHTTVAIAVNFVSGQQSVLCSLQPAQDVSLFWGHFSPRDDMTWRHSGDEVCNLFSCGAAGDMQVPNTAQRLVARKLQGMCHLCWGPTRHLLQYFGLLKVSCLCCREAPP